MFRSLIVGAERPQYRANFVLMFQRLAAQSGIQFHGAWILGLFTVVSYVIFGLGLLAPQLKDTSAYTIPIWVAVNTIIPVIVFYYIARSSYQFWIRTHYEFGNDHQGRHDEYSTLSYYELFVSPQRAYTRAFYFVASMANFREVRNAQNTRMIAFATWMILTLIIEYLALFFNIPGMIMASYIIIPFLAMFIFAVSYGTTNQFRVIYEEAIETPEGSAPRTVHNPIFMITPRELENVVSSIYGLFLVLIIGEGITSVIVSRNNIPVCIFLAINGFFSKLLTYPLIRY